MTNPKQNILDSIETFKKIYGEEYIFSPIANEKEIELFENKFNVRLPEDYRWFLLNIANGIICKDEYQLDFIEKIDFQNFFYEEDEFNPSVPFRLTTKVLFSKPEFEDKYPYEIMYDEDDTIFMNGYLNGEITIASYGCGTFAFLIINGAEFGNVWIDDYSSNQEVYPEYDLKTNRKRLNFNDWLLKRIDRRIEIYHQSIEVERTIKKEQEFEKIEKYRIDEEKKQAEKDERIRMHSLKDKRDFLTILLDKLFG
ncbi:SMI1 / KNR4 family (SUKH-1) [Flavobacterium glycines]|uniref:SMI1 / KNR4 family (SUKH-1) n=1 Tax=Flavobacterium glycines TaxID=551990 RepID=A0A1B9DL27_9FLAO|nr:SMI1/KNR4 family protein [Flavobacterium glycines]OCB70408.1 hypothetical protein FBGL_12660 [Flavobacterium glycines]GEL11545.1 hypothetical protein FGL01_22840 [Flavobacterium glycines]SDJ75562.1 SMI1 / KNR4 family (SUKH-1) [Flavobacterium glycines]